MTPIANTSLTAVLLALLAGAPLAVAAVGIRPEALAHEAAPVARSIGIGEALGQEVVAGVAVGDVLELAALAERVDIRCEDDLHAEIASLSVSSVSR